MPSLKDRSTSPKPGALKSVKAPAAEPEKVSPSQDEKPCACSELIITAMLPAGTEGDREHEFTTGCDETVKGRRNFAAGHDAKLKKTIFAAVRFAAKNKLDINNVDEVAWDYKGKRYPGPVEMATKNLSELLAGQVKRGTELNLRAPEPKAPKGGSSTKNVPREVSAKVPGGKVYKGRAYTDGTFIYKNAKDEEVEVKAGKWTEVEAS